ncbi:hypothetical protein ABKN59_001365 [Abortiporus biennis]
MICCCQLSSSLIPAPDWPHTGSFAKPAQMEEHPILACVMPSMSPIHCSTRKILSIFGLVLYPHLVAVDTRKMYCGLFRAS